MLPLTAICLANEILRVLQALNPDATDPEGEWWAKTHSPFFYLPTFSITMKSMLEPKPFFSHEDACGPVAQLDRAAPS